ncbi:urea ABC transporter permease subunit UrtC [Sphingobium sp. TA15]|uniref:Branched-chain amino acid transport system permease protein n=3 Tax=Sphingobium indicum TaxID=332055 RepID=D4YZJ8_SPHIU|nr:urea ABC transporter permease subunit UrtC [Sphingobium indicum]KEY98047.1 urea ABC transporter permease [Sphingomonas sp. BHC-A]BDD65101.1 urea ABC transporter permease subunit UrtC [Sphingobium sp. TA15]APL94690.1 urea ABC transporter permease subunit UrtC [Sphingobium indicum B90A]NYI23168.1 urea transport system permease protein [Sphingobium indicum]RYM04434.1 urea ABC transporter permease subunit UrtC [Sphingobium indicum]
MTGTLPIKQAATGVALILAIAAPWLLSAYDLNLLARFLALSLTAMGLVLIWGEGGILSLGQGVFFGLGGYALAMHLKLAGLAEGELPDFMIWSGTEALPWWWSLVKSPFAAVAAVLVVPTALGALMAWAIFRRRIGGVYFALITQALALAFATLLVSQQGLTGGFNGLTDYQTLFGFNLNLPSTTLALYFITLALVVAGLLGLRWLLASRYGKLLRASRDGANRMRFLGYDPTPYKVIAFAVAALLTGMSGALFTLHAGVVSPALVGVVPSIEMVIWAAIGGRNSLIGAIAGALLVNFAKDKISTAMPEVWLYGLGALFIAAVTILPQGLAGLFGPDHPFRPGKAGDLFARWRRERAKTASQPIAGEAAP